VQRILEKKAPTRIGFWFCGFLYCNLPLAVAGLAVVSLNNFACSWLVSVWVVTQSVYILLQPFFTLPFFIKPNKRTKAYFLFISIVFLIFQTAWMVFGSILLAFADYGVACRSISLPSWTVMLVLLVFGFLGLLQQLGLIFDASSVEVDTIEYRELGANSGEGGMPPTNVRSSAQLGGL